MWTAAVFLGALLAFAGGAWRPVGKTRTVRLRQGDVVGTVFQSDLQELAKVEVFRGVPYAQAERFMPPSSPARFDYLEATEHGPVCPQSLVDLEGGGMGGGGGRLAYLRRLVPFLKNQSEDCLNLNIYVPEQAFLNGLGGNLNVIVFIHGESFSWNSGNSYDGSTIASYGNIIFVTLNYRLGILGFLNTRNNKTTSNFGLLDQIAALRWLKDNIAAFGGDPDSITLMGHHTGAIAVNYLMLSPVSQADNGLFQRAILMSGTALSSWAESRSPEKVAHSVADQTGCQPYDLIACLRERRLQDILSVKDLPEDPAPSVDGIVVKVQPKDLMSHNNDLFTRYDLLCGVTESESYHILDSFALNQGLFNEDIKELLSKFFRQNFEAWEQSMERAMKVYGLDKPGLGPFEGRDRTLTLLSDARVVAPMAQTAVYHSTPGQTDVRTFFYVFSHRSKRGDHPSAGVSVQGEDLAYVLGVPIEAGQHHFGGDYSQEEKHLSETMMSLWVNFAKTGDPNVPRRRNYITRGHSDWVLEDVDWPTFEPNNQHYYQIQIPPRIGTKYRDNLMHFWNYFLPTWKPLQVPHAPPNKFVTSTNPGFEELPPRKPPQGPGQDWSIFPPWRPTRRPVYGVLVTPRPVNPFQTIPRLAPLDDSPPTRAHGEEEGEEGMEEVQPASSSTLMLVIVLGVLFFLINIVSFAYIWYQKKKLRREREVTARLRRGSPPSIPDTDYDKKDEKCEVKSILKSNERLYDPLKTRASQIGKWAGLYSPGSSSTVTIDTHTKVSQWMKSDKFGFGGKSRGGKSSDTVISAPAAPKSLKSALRKPGVKKVSVAVDATPSARSASVLKQTPIELTKSLDFGKKRLGDTLHSPLRRSDVIESDETLPCHSHSNSDPAQLLLTDIEGKEEKALRTFEPFHRDMRREYGDESLSAEEALDNFKKRNYPKVLPDFPTSPALSSFSDHGRTKRMSLPMPIPIPVIEPKKMPPAPPPRAATATVGRTPRSKTGVPNNMGSGQDLHRTSDREEHSEKEDKARKRNKDEKKKDKEREKRIERRPEPKVIIKPTLTDPNQKKINSKIPRVTAKEKPDTPKEQKRVIKDSKGAQKTQTQSTESSTTSTSTSSSVSSISTVRKARKE